MIRGVLFVAVTLWAAVLSPAYAADLIQAPAEIGIVSSVSDGRNDVQDIVSTARKDGFKVVVLTDRDIMKWEYGAWPLRNIIRKTEENPSITTYGIQNYLKYIDNVRKDNRDMVLIAGTESAPYYHWTGHPIHGNLCINDWHKHILTIGLDTAGAIRDLPVSGNWRALRLPYGPKSLVYLLFPILLVIMGMFGINRRRIDYVDSFGRHYMIRCTSCVMIGTLLVILGVLFLVNNYPYRGIRFDPYRKDAGIAPYQYFIDYVSKHGGLTFWAHPEAEYLGKEGPVRIATKDYTDHLLEADRYTGFAVFYEGYDKAGLPGGIWDEYLKSYCHGGRKKPVWAIGYLGYDGSGNLGKAMKDLRTVLLVPELGSEEALDAMRSGRMYVSRGSLSPDFILQDFAVTDQASGKEAISGQEITVTGKPVIRIKGRFTKGEQVPCAIKIIKNGTVIEIVDKDAPFDLAYEDQIPPGAWPMDYYRIEIWADGLQVVSNPIFARHKEDGKDR